MAAFGPLRGLVLPVAMCMAYLLSTLNTVTPISVDILIKRPGPREHVNQLTHTLTSTELPRDQECLPHADTIRDT